MGRRVRKKAEEIYDVEAIVSKRYNGDCVEYLVKWFNYSSEENTWEPIQHLNCKQMIEEYEETHKGEEPERVVPVIEPGNGFDMNWTPIKVFGATKRQTDGRLMIMIKWKGNHSTFEFAEVANHKIPDLVIAYYEQRIRWKNSSKPMERAIISSEANHNTIDTDLADN